MVRFQMAHSTQDTLLVFEQKVIADARGISHESAGGAFLYRPLMLGFERGVGIGREVSEVVTLEV